MGVTNPPNDSKPNNLAHGGARMDIFWKHIVTNKRTYKLYAVPQMMTLC